MNFTDIFIRRPVLATVISLLLVVLGLMAYKGLPLRQFPQIQFSEVDITSTLPGASAEVMQSFVTTPIQDSISTLDNIDYLVGTSRQGTSTVSVHFFPGTDTDVAVSQITTKIQQIKGTNLPTDMDNPIVQKGNPGSDGVMYIAFYSNEMTPEQISDYLIRIVNPQIQAVPGVASSSSIGGKTYAMRLWLDPQKMAAMNVQPLDVETAITAENVQSAAGYTENNQEVIDLQANTGLHTTADFDNMIVLTTKTGEIIRLKDIGHAELGASDYHAVVLAGGKQAVVVKVSTKTMANPLQVAQDIRKILPQIFHQMPFGLHAEVVYDLSAYIKQSINTVVETIIEAAIIVILVIYLSLGSLRSVIVPVVTIPLSLIGVMAIMYVLGYSLNVLTLMAMVLAIGLVVDDAIVVVENISRHLEEGLPPMQAAYIGAREIASPVITMSITLAAVFIPIGFSGGVSGVLFSEFAFTLAGAVLLSGVIALTLSPMMCARVLNATQLQGKFIQRVEFFYSRLARIYQTVLRSILDSRWVVIVFMSAVLAGVFFLYMTTQAELAPSEDQGYFYSNAQGPVNANVGYTTKYMQQVEKIYERLPGVEQSLVFNGQGGWNMAQTFVKLKPLKERRYSQMQLVNMSNQQTQSISGLDNRAFNPPTLPGGDFGLPLNFVLVSARDYNSLYAVAEELVQKAKASGMFQGLQNTLQLNKPTINISVDHAKAGELGITSQQISDALNVMMSNKNITRFDMDGRNYYVIPQAYLSYRETPNTLSSIYVTSTLSNPDKSPILVPLSSFVHMEGVVKPVTLPQFQRLNSATINAQMMPGYTLADGIKFFANQANKIMPAGMSYELTGDARTYEQESGRMLITFLFALIIIFLVLAAQFESFRDPFIILLSVPMSMFGALIPLNLGFGTINIFSQIGLLTLVGLISKHGILIVQFANRIQETEGLHPHEAVIRGATLRLRPILMTSAAMILGVTPLLFSTVGLANSQHDVALVIFFGLLIGTFFTLFVVPTMYSLIGRDRRHPTLKEPLHEKTHA